MNLEQIDTSTTEGKARVMQLAAEGRKVAIRSQPGAHPMNSDVNLYPWVYSAGIHPSWNWSQCEYAIVAEPVGPEEVYLSIKGEAIIMAVVREEDAQKRFAGLPVVRYIRADLAGEGK